MKNLTFSCSWALKPTPMIHEDLVALVKKYLFREVPNARGSHTAIKTTVPVFSVILCSSCSPQWTILYGFGNFIDELHARYEFWADNRYLLPYQRYVRNIRVPVLNANTTFQKTCFELFHVSQANFLSPKFIHVKHILEQPHPSMADGQGVLIVCDCLGGAVRNDLLGPWYDT